MTKGDWGAFEVSLTARCAQRDVVHALFRRTAVVVQMAIQEFMQCFLECSFDAAELRVIGAGVGWLVYQFDERVDTSIFWPRSWCRNKCFGRRWFGPCGVPRGRRREFLRLRLDQLSAFSGRRHASRRSASHSLADSPRCRGRGRVSPCRGNDGRASHSSVPRRLVWVVLIKSWWQATWKKGAGDPFSSSSKRLHGG
jgi:hypothetical protein